MSSVELFNDLEPEVIESTKNIQEILEKFPSSELGGSLMRVYSGEYYTFYGALWEGLEKNKDVKDHELFKLHLGTRLSFDDNILALVISRVIRRALYCRCFNGIDLALMKQAGLYAYWITKLHPIVVAKAPEGIDPLPSNLEMAIQQINERFAFHIINLFYMEEKGKGLDNCIEYQKHFLHAVKFRSFTEDSMMLVTESLGEIGTSAPLF